MREKTNITVTVVDFRPMLDKLKEYYIKACPEFKEKEFKLFLPETWGFIETQKGKLMICDEGVVDSNPVCDRFPFLASLHIEEKQPENKFSFMPLGMIRVQDIKEIEELPVIDKKPLEDFIRTFSNRLETNFKICRKFLNPITKRP